MMKFIYLILACLFLSGCAVGNAEDLPKYSSFSERVVLRNGDSFELVADEVQMDIAGEATEMMAYNGTIPGPIVVVEQGSTIEVNFKNNLSVESSLHSHGLRLRNEFDGVPGVTQEEVLPGEQFRYELDFPDAGVYFYHPHTREDYQQDAGLYGAFVVLPSENLDNEFGADLKEDHSIVFLDDLQLGPWGDLQRNKDEVEQTLMGRFGNTMFINGELRGVVDLGEFYKGESMILTFVNVANVRPYNLKIPGVKMTLLADDASAFTKLEVVDELVVGPSERYTVKLEFEDVGEFEMVSTKGKYDYKIAIVSVVEGDGEREEILVEPLELSGVKEFINMPVEKSLKLDMWMDMPSHGNAMMGVPCHQMSDGSWMGDCGEEIAGHYDDGIEWEDEMPMMNKVSNLDNVQWNLVDPDTGLKNMDIDWEFSQGDIVKIRVENVGDSMHPMQHPIHLHGQRFLVLSKDGEIQENLAWNDTVLIPSGETYDIIVEMNNPGTWMAHCHIPEHMEAGMMMKFEVI